MDEAWDEYDLILARDILGVADQQQAYEFAAAWTAGHLGAPVRVVSSILSIGAVFVLETEDGSRAVLKAWRHDRDPAALTAQVRVQGAFADSGRAAPRPLSDVLPFGEGHAMLMEFRGGEIADTQAPCVAETLAAGLYDFIRFASSLPLDPDLPRHGEAPPGALWRPPHNALFDFEATAAGAEWIDEAVKAPLEIMRAARGPEVTGHEDWTASNTRMRDGKIVAIYDWDSVCRWPETLMVGGVSAHFCVQWDLPIRHTPSPAEMARFIAAYESARGERFSDAQMAEVAASATYFRAYKARCEHCWDPGRSKKWEDSSRRELWELGAYTPEMLRA